MSDTFAPLGAEQECAHGKHALQNVVGVDDVHVVNVLVFVAHFPDLRDGLVHGDVVAQCCHARVHYGARGVLGVFQQLADVRAAESG